AIIDGSLGLLTYMENNSGIGTIVVRNALNISIATITPGTVVLNHNGGTAHFNNQVDYTGMVVSKTGSTSAVTIAYNSIDSPSLTSTDVSIANGGITHVTPYSTILDGWNGSAYAPT